MTEKKMDPQHERMYERVLKSHIGSRKPWEFDVSRVTTRAGRSEEELEQLRDWLQYTNLPNLLKLRMLQHPGLSLRLLCNMTSLREMALFLRNELSLDHYLLALHLWTRINEFKEICLMDSVDTSSDLIGGLSSHPVSTSRVKRPSTSHRRTSSKMKDRSSFLRPRLSGAGLDSLHERKTSSDRLSFDGGHRRSSAILHKGGKRRLTAKDESCVDILNEMCGYISDPSLKEFFIKLIKNDIAKFKIGGKKHSQSKFLDTLYKIITYLLESASFITLDNLYDMISSVESRPQKNFHTKYQSLIMNDKSMLSYELNPFECDSMNYHRTDGGIDILDHIVFDDMCEDMKLNASEQLWFRHVLAQGKCQVKSLRDTALQGITVETNLTDGPPMMPGAPIEVALRTAFNDPISVADATGKSRSKLKAWELSSMYTGEFAESMAEEFEDKVSGKMDKVEKLINDLDLIRITFNGTDRTLLNLGYKTELPPKDGEDETKKKEEDDKKIDGGGGFGGASSYGGYGMMDDEDDKDKEEKRLNVQISDTRTARAHEPRGKVAPYLRKPKDTLPLMNLAELVDCLWEWEDTRTKLDESMKGADNSDSAASLVMNPEMIDELCPIKTRPALLRENPQRYPIGEVRGVTQEEHLNSMTLSGLGKFSGMARLYYGMLESMAVAQRHENDIDEPAEEYTEREQEEAHEEMEKFMEYGAELAIIAKEWHRTKDDLDKPRSATVRLDGRAPDSSIDVSVGREAIVVPDAVKIDRTIVNAADLPLKQLEKSVELARNRQLVMARELEKSRAILSELEKRVKGTRRK